MLWPLLGCDGKGVTEPEDGGDIGCVVAERALDSAIRFDGEADGDWAGGAVGAGDVDGDGRADVLVGAADNGEAGSEAGAVYVVTTGANAVGLRNATQFAGTSAEDHAGWSVAGVGDLDGDGRDDFAFGAPGNDEGGRMAGSAALVLGGSVTAWSYGAEGEGAGASVAGPGDVNGDGHDDVVVGADSAGAVYVLLGGREWETSPLIDELRYTGTTSGYAGCRRMPQTGEKITPVAYA